MSRLTTPPTRIKELSTIPGRLSRAYLAESYDGIGQYVKVGMTRGGVTNALQGRVASGDFGGGRTFPEGTPVVISTYRGQIEVFLGNNADLCAKSAEPAKAGSWIIDSAESGYSELYFGAVGADGSLYVQLDGGTLAYSEGTGTGLIKIDKTGTVVWGRATSFLADPITWFDHFVYQFGRGSVLASQTMAEKSDDETGEIIWSTPITGPGGNLGARNGAVDSDGGCWISYHESLHGSWYALRLNSDGAVTFGPVVMGSLFEAPGLLSSADREFVFSGPGSPYTFGKYDKDWNPVPGFANPQVPANRYQWGATADGGFVVWSAGSLVYGGAGTTVYTAPPVVLRYDENGELLWTSSSAPYNWEDSTDNGVVEICGKIYLYGIDQANEFAGPDHFMYTGLLVLDSASGEFISYQLINYDTPGPLGAYLDTYLHAAGYGWMWVGGATYSSYYDGIGPLDPLVADYGFLSLLKLRN